MSRDSLSVSQWEVSNITAYLFLEWNVLENQVYDSRYDISPMCDHNVTCWFYGSSVKQQRSFELCTLIVQACSNLTS